MLNSKNDTSTDKFFYTLKFKNSALTIEYFDYVYDGFGSTLSTEKVTAKNGQICDVSVFNSSDVSKTIGAFCNYGEANSIAIVVDNLTSQADVDANLLVVEQIVSSLDFNLFPIGHVTPTVLRAVPTIPVGNTNIFTSKKYTVSFKYPKSLGLATTSNDSAGNEVVSFTNSKVNVIYPNFDMGPGAGSIYYNLNTKDGKTFEIEQYSDNTDSKPNSIFAYCISSLTSSNGSVVLTLYNQSNLADDELIIEQIISNLTYTF